MFINFISEVTKIDSKPPQQQSTEKTTKQTIFITLKITRRTGKNALTSLYCRKSGKVVAV